MLHHCIQKDVLTKLITHEPEVARCWKEVIVAWLARVKSRGKRVTNLFPVFCSDSYVRLDC